MNAQPEQTAIARRSIIGTMAARNNMEAQAFEATLRATVFPKDGSREQFAAFLLVASQYNLNPLLKEIYAFPGKSGGIQPIVSVDGWANLINSHPQMDGLEFDDVTTMEGELISITCKIWRKDRTKPIMVTEYMSECRRNTDVWKQWPRRLLRHKALIQCGRYAFGFAGIVDQDEAERAFEVDQPSPGIVELKEKLNSPSPGIVELKGKLPVRLPEEPTQRPVVSLSPFPPEADSASPIYKRPVGRPRKDPPTVDVRAESAKDQIRTILAAQFVDDDDRQFALRNASERNSRWLAMEDIATAPIEELEFTLENLKSSINN